MIYSTLEDTIKAMDNVARADEHVLPGAGSYSSQQLSAYMKFTEAREMLNNYQTQYDEANAQYEAAKEKALASADVAKQLDIDTLAPSSTPRTSPCPPATSRTPAENPGC